MEAAALMLKAGDFKQHCEILIKLEKWEDAIAVAPKVSLQYWESLVHRYQEVL